jgi:hypothetical protein
VAATCEYRPPVGEFDPVVEWEWHGLRDDPSVNIAAGTPAVADIDRDGTPEVVFIATSNPLPVPLSSMSVRSEARSMCASTRTLAGSACTTNATKKTTARRSPPGAAP